MNSISWLLSVSMMVIAINIVIVASSNSTPPTMISTFRSPYTLVITSGTPAYSQSTTMRGETWYDEPNLRSYSEWVQNIALTDYHSIVRQAISPTISWYWISGRCLNVPLEWRSFGVILPNTTYAGNITVDGRNCELWKLSIPGVLSTSYAMIGSIPVQINSTYIIDRSTGQFYETFMGFSSSLTPLKYINDSLFDPPPACIEQAVCPLGPVVENEIWRLHTVDDFALVNHNVADVLGDAMFVCQVALGIRPSNDQLLSLFRVEMNTTWGAYSPCNGGECSGGSKILVGREAAEGVKWNGGQCADNSEIGTWYSLTEYGECPDNQPVGYNGCTWRTRALVKTVQLSCLVEQGLANACKVDYQMPFINSARVMERAMRYTDPSDGGCPNVDSGAFAKQRIHSNARVSMGIVSDGKPSANDQYWSLHNAIARSMP